MIADIRIAGLDRVSEHLVREQIQLQPGQPLDLSSLARSRRNLYNSGAFSVVDITRRERRGLGQEPAATSPDQRPILLNVTIREVQPVQIRYGASYDTERGVGGIFDISNKNSLGGAREIGLRSRYDKQLHEGRIYLNQPALKYLPKTTGSIYFREELNPPTAITDPFDVSRKGFSVQSEQRLRNAYVLNYGYRLERAHTLTPTGDVVLDEALTVSPVTSTLSRESRDEVLDASRGTFLSQAFRIRRPARGDRAYIKYFGQYSSTSRSNRPGANRSPTRSCDRAWSMRVRFGLASAAGWARRCRGPSGSSPAAAPPCAGSAKTPWARSASTASQLAARRCS